MSRHTESSLFVLQSKSLSQENGCAKTFPELTAASIGRDTLPTSKAATAINRSLLMSEQN